jgi:hypothetical protein
VDPTLDVETGITKGKCSWLVYSCCSGSLSLTHTCTHLFCLVCPLHYRWEYFSSVHCRWCPDWMDVAETNALLGNLQNAEDWEKAFCDQVTGSKLFPGMKGCRILTETAPVPPAQSS